MCFLVLQQRPPSTQTLRVLHENSRGRGTRGVLDWPYPTSLDLPTPGTMSSSRSSTEATMRADYMASHSSHRFEPSPTGKGKNLTAK